MESSGRLPPADKAALGSRHRTKYRQQLTRHLGLCWDRCGLRVVSPEVALAR